MQKESILGSQNRTEQTNKKCSSFLIIQQEIWSWAEAGRHLQLFSSSRTQRYWDKSKHSMPAELQLVPEEEEEEEEWVSVRFLSSPEARKQFIMWCHFTSSMFQKLSHEKLSTVQRCFISPESEFRVEQTPRRYHQTGHSASIFPNCYLWYCS